MFSVSRPHDTRDQKKCSSITKEILSLVGADLCVIQAAEHARRAIMEYLEREERRLGLPPADEKEGNADDH